MVTKQLLQEWANPKTCSSSQSAIECPKNLCIWEIYSGLHSNWAVFSTLRKLKKCVAAPLRRCELCDPGRLFSFLIATPCLCRWAQGTKMRTCSDKVLQKCSHYTKRIDWLSACFLSLAVSCAGHWYSALKLEATKEMWSRQVICMCVCVCRHMLRYTFRNSMFALCIHIYICDHTYIYTPMGPLELEVRRRWSQPVEVSWVHNLGRVCQLDKVQPKKNGCFQVGENGGYCRYCVKVWKVKRICKRSMSIWWILKVYTESTLSLNAVRAVALSGILVFSLLYLPNPFSKEKCWFLLILDGSIYLIHSPKTSGVSEPGAIQLKGMSLRSRPRRLSMGAQPPPGTSGWNRTWKMHLEITKNQKHDLFLYKKSSKRLFIPGNAPDTFTFS